MKKELFHEIILKLFILILYRFTLRTELIYFILLFFYVASCRDNGDGKINQKRNKSKSYQQAVLAFVFHIFAFCHIHPHLITLKSYIWIIQHYPPSLQELFSLFLSFFIVFAMFFCMFLKRCAVF